MSSTDTTTTPKPELKSYRGNCHCGAFIFTLLTSPIVSAEYCNCSICRKKGYLWTQPDFSTGDKWEVVKDEGKTTAYVTGPSGKTKHLFCSECGTGLYAINEEDVREGKKGLWVNARAIQDLKIWDLEVKEFDGKSIPPPYHPTPYDGPEPSAEIENGVVYHGSCHCGAVKLAVKTNGPLDKTYKERVMECNCSICQRGGYIWIYPSHPQQRCFSPSSHSSLSSYACLKKVMLKTFCKICGVHLTNETNEAMTDEMIRAQMPGEDAEMALRWRNVVWPINIRCLDAKIGEDGKEDEKWSWEEMIKELDVQRGDGWGMIKPGYVNP
ncbi:Mss4-like protein [Sordaria brevicollis]|uniref:Mss4-like protein n=1 Tax=Sordaria brevicollis TaxID=83679 RepID=A0AAE0PEJ5_SORBR|nr:Mss4-like protein [Sordaria brevicollis]